MVDCIRPEKMGDSMKPTLAVPRLSALHKAAADSAEDLLDHGLTGNVVDQGPGDSQETTGGLAGSRAHVRLLRIVAL